MRRRQRYLTLCMMCISHNNTCNDVAGSKAAPQASLRSVHVLDYLASAGGGAGHWACRTKSRYFVFPYISSVLIP